jgi:hypothetical protein
MKIGIDFDNTIIDYGQLFHKYAVDRFGMPPSIGAEKTSVKAYFLSLPNGNTPWTELQGIVYGEKILEATLYNDCGDFLLYCKDKSIPVCVISHKSEFPALGPRINLRTAAIDWLAKNGFFDQTCFALEKSSVFFEPTRLSKLSRIASQECTIFIDDLPEIFEDKDFPQNVRKILFSSENVASNNVSLFDNWNAIKNFIFNHSE